MKTTLFGQGKRLACVSGLLMLGSVGLSTAQTPKKPAPAPAKAAPAPAPKAATPAPKAAGGTSAATAAHPAGATTAGHTGATTTSTSKGPTTASPGGGAKTTTATTTGAKTTTTATPGAVHGTAGATGGAPTTNSARGGFGGSAAGAHPNTAAHGPIGRPAPTGAHEMRAANGATVRTRPNGMRSDVHDERRGMDVHHGLNGERRVSVEHADHSRIYAERGGRGYVQHPYMYHGREFGHRTYYRDGRAYDRYYGRYPYRGAYLDVYAPNRYYAPGFYGWAYNPWSAPITYSWGWNANPWYGYYGASYFTPYPVYPSASFWLTDYLISQSLAAAYQAQLADAQAGAAPLQGAAPLTPDVKKMVADEVQRQVALENAEAAQNAQKQDIDSAGSSIARMLSDNQPHVFVAGASLDLVNNAGAECAVSQGDVLEVATPPPADATTATAMVLSSKGGKECVKSDNVQVAFNDLQDMQNHMRETIDQGLGDLQSKQGQGGLPPAPPSAKAPPVNSVMAAAAPPPDPDAANQIKQQMQEADKAEQEVASVTPPAAPGTPTSNAAAPPVSGPPPTISIGQSLGDVTAAFGQPTKVLDKGVTKIYVYSDMKVTIKGNKVTAVE